MGKFLWQLYRIRHDKVEFDDSAETGCIVQLSSLFIPPRGPTPSPGRKQDLLFARGWHVGHFFFESPRAIKRGWKSIGVVRSRSADVTDFRLARIKDASDLSRKKSIAFTSPVMWNKLTVNKAISINLHRLTKVFDHTDGNTTKKKLFNNFRNFSILGYVYLKLVMDILPLKYKYFSLPCGIGINININIFYKNSRNIWIILSEEAVLKLPP